MSTIQPLGLEEGIVYQIPKKDNVGKLYQMISDKSIQVKLLSMSLIISLIVLCVFLSFNNESVVELSRCNCASQCDIYEFEILCECDGIQLKYDCDTEEIKEVYDTIVVSNVTESSRSSSVISSSSSSNDNGLACLIFPVFCIKSSSNNSNIVDICDNVNCNNGNCVVLSDNNYTCDCDDGFYSDYCNVTFCDQWDVCGNMLCNDNDPDNIYCVQDELTDEIIDICSDIQCNNGACSVNINGIGSCNCNDDYYGDYCNQTICQYDNPCSINGYCYESEGNALCNCSSGYYGNTCQYTNVCYNQSCNDGICVNDNNSMYCECNQYSYGEYCNKTFCEEYDICSYRNMACNDIDPTNVYCEEIPVTDSISEICSTINCNNGTCVIDSNEQPSCYCIDNYYGDYCNETICDYNNPCINGNCSTIGNDVTCTCNSGYYGDQCEYTDSCINHNCNNGECINIDDSMFCSCDDGYYGDNCEINRL